MKINVFFYLLLFFTSCITNEGEINIVKNTGPNSIGAPDTTDADNTSPPEEAVNNSNSQNEILIDFTDPNELANHFSTYLKTSTFTQDTISIISGNSAGKCNSSSTYSSCNFKSIQTFNLPISFEIETSAYNTYSSGTRYGVAIYEGTASRWSAYYDNPNDGTNYGSVMWEYVGNNFIKSWGIYGEKTIGTNLSNHGKISVNILADLSYTITYTEYDNSGNYLNEHVVNGTLSANPQNFNIEFYQMNFQANRYFIIDNLKIIYEQ